MEKKEYFSPKGTPKNNGYFEDKHGKSLLATLPERAREQAKKSPPEARTKHKD